jgi:lysozyme
MNLIDWMQREEGCKLYAYQDSLGFWTIGYGTLIDQRGGGITEEEALYLLTHRLDTTKNSVISALPWVSGCAEVRQAVIFAMAFQLGLHGMLAFHRMLTAAHDGNWELAAKELLNSKLATQTPARAQRTAEMLRTGEWPL